MTNLMFIWVLLNAVLFSSDIQASPIQPKIVGGNKADASRWPWMVALVYKSSSLSARPEVFCGGSLVAKDWVLTAASCVNDKLESGIRISVLVNRPNITTQQGEIINVQSIVIHPQYKPVTDVNNIALLKLAKSSTVAPIASLGNFSSQDQSGKSAIILGWGSQTANKTSSEIILTNDLQEASLPITSNAVCNNKLPNSSPLNDSGLCAGFPQGGVDTCVGDGGGPLIVFDDESQSWRLAGITSYGVGDCAAPGLYGVYTRVKRFNDLISQTICSAGDIPSTPTIKINTNGTQVSADWTSVANASGYRLYYAPYPAMSPISSLDLKQSTHLEVSLPLGSAFYVAVQAYKGPCLSSYSNIGQFVLQ